jgi:hypothetical protein
MQKTLSVEPSLSSSPNNASAIAKAASDNPKLDKKRRSNMLTIGRNKKPQEIDPNAPVSAPYKPALESTSQLSISSLDQIFTTPSPNASALSKSLEQFESKEAPSSSMTTLEVGKASFSGSASVPGIPESHQHVT